MVGAVALALCCPLLLRTEIPPALAQTSDEDARKHFDAGESYFKTSDYDGALREFQRAYQLSKRPLVLVSIAAVYERMGKLRETVETLTRYLNEDPNTKEKTTIEIRIENLKKRLDQQAQAKTPDAEAGATAAPSAPSSAPPAPSSSSSVPAPVTGEPVSPTTQKPNRLPAYITWGVGGAAAIGALVTGLLANNKYNNAKSGCGSTPVGCSDSEIQPVKDMALVSTILTGAAVVGAGLGTFLFLSAKPPTSEKATRTAPGLSIGFGPGGGKLDVVWRF